MAILGPAVVYVLSFQGGGGGGGTPRGAGVGLSLNGNDLDIDNPFTDADETKLDGIAAGAQVNPRHVALPFRSFDANSVLTGTFHPYKSDNSLWQSGSSLDIAAIEVHPTQYLLNQNPQTDNASYTAWHSLADDLIANGGSSIWTFQRIDNTTGAIQAGKVFHVQVEALSKNSDGNYVLSNLVHLIGFNNTDGAGNDWQIAAAFTPPVGADAVIGVLSKPTLPADVVYAEMLKGSETDRYASYTNAFLAATDRRGSVCLFNTAVGPPTDANAIGQPDIADRDTNGIIAFAAILRGDRDPNQLVWNEANVAADYSNGDVIHISVWNKPNARVKVTLTSNGTLVGNGNAAYIWATATWDEIENIPDVADVGNYFLLSEDVPSKLPIDIPATDILDPPWLEPTGVERTDGDISVDTELQLANGDKIEAGEFVEWHDEHHVGTFTLTGLRYNTSNSNMDAGDVNWSPNLGNPAKGIFYYKYADAAARESLKAKIIVGRDFEFASTSPTATVKGTIASTPLDFGGRLSFNLNNVVTGGNPANDAESTVIVDSNIAARNQFNSIAFDGIPIKRFVNSDIGTTIENIATGLNNNDLIHCFFEYTDSSSGAAGVRGITAKFSDFDNDDRLVMYLQGNNEAGIISRSGSNLRCKRGGGLSALSSIVYVERRTFTDVSL